ncbi:MULTISPECIES: nuclear transport factor 2 family protein [unclassified Microbacterium]|uniref:nuclear transport factor 2 family protein n=1 Tax=unclassified Microbacterium TaxID=2609290 RepID=UPI003745997F
MDEIGREAMSGIERLELELIVRDFFTILNDGCIEDLLAFLTEDVVYKPSPRQAVTGRAAVIAMVSDIRTTFDEWKASLIDVAVTGDVVLAELALRVKLPIGPPEWLLSFASFRLDGYRISSWHQVHG